MDPATANAGALGTLHVVAHAPASTPNYLVAGMLSAVLSGEFSVNPQLLPVLTYLRGSFVPHGSRHAFPPVCHFHSSPLEPRVLTTILVNLGAVFQDEEAPP